MIKVSKAYFTIVFLFLLSFTCNKLLAQGFGFEFTDNRKRITIPFEEHNNLVVIPIIINNSLKLKFIVDTGVQNSILTEKALADALNLEYKRRISIAGPGLVDSVAAYLSNKVKLEIPGGIVAFDRTLLVLEEDYLDLERQTGEDIYGIIGYELFSKFIIELDYDKKEITFHDPKYFKKRRRYKRIPLSIEKTKPYLQTSLGFYDDDNQNNVKLMIDSGASHSLLLDPEEDENIVIPDKVIVSNLGKGLGGDIGGKIGRVNKFSLLDYKFNNVVASFPDAGEYNKNIKRGSRSGTMGGGVLSRINPIFDYFNNYLYVRKGKRYKNPFDFDMSGLRLSAFGLTNELAIIDDVICDSPAEKAGIKKGDIIKKLNGNRVEYISLNDIFTILRKRNNYKIKMKIVRNGTEIKKSFRLRRLI